MALNLESSMTDLMTSLAVVFILLMLALAQNQGQGSQTALKEIQQKIDASLAIESLRCETDEKDPLSCIIRLPDEKLRFLVNKADIDPQGQVFIKRVFPKVMHVLSEPVVSPDVESLYIQGFTDSDGNDEHNLELSQQRAFAVGRFVVSYVIPPSQERTDLLKWLYVNGRGEQERVYFDPKTKQHENKQGSRRVEVRIRVKSGEQRNQVEQSLKEGQA
jgi:outer membrane protein OmpA-like peptidoglycan-associated protein